MKRKPGGQPSTPEKFWANVDVRGPEECWAFLKKSRNEYGHGLVGYHKKLWKAHRLAWTLWHKQDIPEGGQVLHRCDNAPCCNPSHLYIGTPADNVRDMVERGRCSKLKGEQTSNAKLKEHDVRRIRELWASGEHSQAAIGRMYGVTPPCIRDIIIGRQWAHVT